MKHCDNYQLAPLFIRLLPTREPVLEAGCGSGRWVAWLTRAGVVGLDWSVALCERAEQAVPEASFVVGDLRSTPFDDDEFGSITGARCRGALREGPSPVLYTGLPQRQFE